MLYKDRRSSGKICTQIVLRRDKKDLGGNKIAMFVRR